MRPLSVLRAALAPLALAAALLAAPGAPPPALFARAPIALLGATPARAQAGAESAVGDTSIPAAVGFVNDFARLMDDDSRAKLEAFLDQVKQKTGAEFAVLTMPTTAPYDPVDYKVKVFERWKLGKQGKDNGVLLLVAVTEHKIWFETGYGLEGTLPDGLQARIIREEMTPRFRAGDWAGGITAAVLRTSALIAKEQGVTLQWDGRELRYSESSQRRGQADRFPVWAIALIIFFIMSLLRAMSGGRRYRGIGPWYGGFGGWGGGFGGGSSGGFGGGGSSFGGFGGGSSGGGGGGGSW